jgi:hypothetical protein
MNGDIRLAHEGCSCFLCVKRAVFVQHIRIYRRQQRMPEDGSPGYAITRDSVGNEALTRTGDGTVARKADDIAVRWNGHRHKELAIVHAWLGKPPALVRQEMQVLCRKTKGNAEFHCCVCGQGFVMFWERQSRSERAEIMHEIQETMRRHHRTAPGPEAHPLDGFLAPQMVGSLEMAGVGVTTGAPAWDL